MLFGIHYLAPEGTAIAVVNLNCGDGTRKEYEIVYGRHVRDCEVYYDPLTTTDLGRVAWEGEDTLPQTTQAVPPSRLRVYQRSWENPRPNEEVVSLDLVSTMTASAPFVIAVTVE